jgi:endoglucanase
MRANGRRSVRTRCRLLKTFSALVAGAFAVSSLLPSAANGAPEWGATQNSIGYWHTSGNRIVDANGHSVRIAAVNWFGMENLYFVPAGLDRQPLDEILARVRSLGFNAIRLPFSNELVEANPIVTGHLYANPSLRGLHALDILDRIVTAAGRHDLRIMLDNGRSGAGTYPRKTASGTRGATPSDPGSGIG